MKELIKELKSIIQLLKEEKQALIENNGDRVGELVVLKSESIDKLVKFKGMDVENNKEAMKLIKEINSLQEINLLLTKQALAFQNSILESISKNVKKVSNTYSAKGNYELKNNVSLIDQSV